MSPATIDALVQERDLLRSEVLNRLDALRAGDTAAAFDPDREDDPLAISAFEGEADLLAQDEPETEAQLAELQDVYEGDLEAWQRDRFEYELVVEETLPDWQEVATYDVPDNSPLSRMAKRLRELDELIGEAELAAANVEGWYERIHAPGVTRGVLVYEIPEDHRPDRPWYPYQDYTVAPGKALPRFEPDPPGTRYGAEAPSSGRHRADWDAYPYPKGALNSPRGYTPPAPVAPGYVAPKRSLREWGDLIAGGRFDPTDAEDIQLAVRCEMLSERQLAVLRDLYRYLHSPVVVPERAPDADEAG